ncbi:Panacea domain-containing protein [Clostridium perfringens]|uniref:Panacea domain-containing protein n=1 Tax=Clostridium perfringens TaxID=1502 RepID=UPI00399D3611
MYYHYILMFSDYEQGTRKAYYKTFADVKEMRKFRDEIKQIKGDFRNVTFSSHQVMTNSEQISSVPEYDRYFEGVEFYSEKELFEKELKISTKITPSDILKYVLIEKKCTKLKAMKLIYFIYEEYLKITGKYLFEEEFETFRLGPVERSSYSRLCKYESELIKLEDIDVEKAKLSLKLDMIDDKENVKLAVKRALDKYGSKKASKLVDLTHEKGTPWSDIEDSLGLFKIIPKELIKEYVLTN